ncbi:MAG: ATP-binding protein [Thiovulaceae bacterium]|nr:ATP-binding protein [Sulfurimonadaceae bacterium]
MNYFNNLMIRTKLIIALLSLASIGLMLGFINILHSSHQSKLIKKMYTHPYTVSNTVREIQTTIITIHRDMKDVTLKINELEFNSQIKKVDQLEKKVFQLYKKIYNLYLGDKKEIQFNEELFRNWKPIRSEIINKTQQGKIKEAAAITKGKGARYVKKLTDSVRKLVIFADSNAKNFFDDSIDAQEYTLNITIFLFGLLFIITLLAIYGVNQDISTPLRSLVKLMKHIGQDDLSRKEFQGAVSLASRKDEIGSLFSSFEKMLRFIKEAYHTLDQEKKYIEAIIQSNSTAIIALNAKGTILTYNLKAQQLFGYTQKEMMGTNNVDLIIPNNFIERHHKAFDKFIQSKAETISQAPKELTAQRKDGTIFPIKLSFGLSTQDNETIVIANITDVTYEKELVKELQERSLELLSLNQSLEERVNQELIKNQQHLQKNFDQARLAQMGEMISMIAHQWRQPLSAVTSITANLLIKLQFIDTTPYGKEILQLHELFGSKLHEIDRIMQLLSQTIDDFRNFYRPDKEKKIIKVNAPIDKALSIIEASLKSKGVELDINYQTTKEFSVHESELMQVLLNILKNAEDNFLEKEVKNPHISINTLDTNEGIQIKVCDNGGGINDEIIQKIFTPYFSTKDEKNGTGLGLYMCKIIIEDHHGGTLDVFNEAEGCCFLIQLKS